MYIKFRTRTTSRIRILAFCMALMICWMSVVHGFRVYGETYDISDGESNIKTSSTNGSTQNTSNGIARATSGNLSYTYTGEMYVDGSVSLYDYLSDKEIIGESIYSTASGYTDAYTILNTKISQSGASEYPASGNITITYTPSASESEVFKASLKRIWVHLWNSSDKTNKATGWPGIVMEYNNSTNKFECTVNRNMLNFDPNCLIFHDYKGTQSDAVEQSLSVQHTYNFKQSGKVGFNCRTGGYGDTIKGKCYNDSKTTGNTVYITMSKYDTGGGYNFYKRLDAIADDDHSNFIPTKISFKASNGSSINTNQVISETPQFGWVYLVKDDGTVLEKHPYVELDGTPANTAQALNGSVYDTPLYFGCLYKETDYLGYKAPYDNFYWQANIAQRGTGTNSVSVQGLVNYNLNGVPTQNSTPVNLPFFTDGTGTAFDGIIKGYEGLQFPFYQIKAQANLIKGNDNISSHYAKFYQFNAKETNVQLAKDENNNYSIVESDVQISSQKTYNGDRTPGFFPFNTTNSTDNDAPTNNLGFGAVFTVDFYLNKDGLVDTYDSDDNTTGSKVRTMFEFVGDDDVWVFIDDKLVLDLGGDHKDTSGLIDFYEKKAYANSALKFGLSGGTTEEKDNLTVSTGTGDGYIGTKERVLVAADGGNSGVFTAANDDVYEEGGAYKYNENKKHTMKVFYMERGMYESDLLIRFNFGLATNENIFKVREVTTFDHVNDGLKAITKKAADNDVFQYIVSNDGTSNSERRNSGILTPTYDYYKRTNSDATDTPTAMLTGGEVNYRTIPETTYIYLDCSQELGGGGNWYKDDAKIWAWMWGEGVTGHVVIPEELDQYDEPHTYKFNAEFGGKKCTDVIFVRFSSDSATPVNGSTTWPAGTEYARVNKSFTDYGATFKITNWSTAESRTNVVLKEQRYYKHNYTPGDDPSGYVAVTNTNYIWTDEYAAKDHVDPEDDKIDGMTGTTNASNGIFSLMYGTAYKESSALFKYQFATDTRMKVEQQTALAKINNRSAEPVSFSASTRNVSTYYDTTVKYFAYNGAGNPYVEKPTTYNGEFQYKNGTRADAHDPVDITEEFTNRVLVGAISVKKELVHNTEPGDTFNFTLELTDVLGQDGVDVTDYDTIKVSVDGAAPVADKITTSDGKGTFTLTKGQTLTIYGIPAGTKYNITEETPTDNYQKKQDNGKMSGTVKQGVLKEGQSDYSSYTNYDPHDDNKVVVTNERRVGDLTLTKALVGEENADTPQPNNATPYTLKVTLNAPTGVNLNNYFANNTPTITTSGTQTGVISAVTTYSNAKYEFNVTVYPKDGSHNNTVTVKNIPYGTTYTVEEVFSEANHPSPKYTYTEGNGTSYTSKICNDTTVVNVTNVYRKVTMTKKDNKDTSKTLSGASFVLVRLKEDAYITSGGHTVLNAGAIAAFNAAESTDFTAALLDPSSTADLSNYIDGYSTILTTGTHDGSAQDDGVVVVNDSMMTGGLKPGQYFFIELTAPSDYYEKNNNSSIDYNNKGSTATQYKVFEIADTIPSNLTETQTEINYYDERKLCALIVQEDVLQSTIDAYGASASQSFTVLVQLDGTTQAIDPAKFFTDDYLTSISATKVENPPTNTFSFTVPVSKGNDKNIVGIPLGVSYTVSDTFSDITPPSGSSWKSFSSNNTSNNITSSSTPTEINSVTYPTETAYIKNAMVGSLVLSKALAYGTTNTENRTFDFNVNMTIPDDVTIYTLQRTVGTGSASNITGLSGHDITISQTMSVGTDVTISNVPYGTTYSVEETEPGGDWGIINQVNTTNNTINNTTKTTTITNGKVGKLNLNKIIAGEYKKNGVKVGDDFEFTVTLTNNNNSLSNIKVDGVTPTISDQYNVTLTVSVPAAVSAASATPVVISNIPYGTTYSVSETQPENCTTTGGVTDQTIGNSNSVTITNTYTAPPPMSVTINMTKTDSETGLAITNSDSNKRAKYVLLKLTEAFQTAYENNPTSVSNAFKNSSSYNDDVLNSYISATASADKTVGENGQVSFASASSEIPGGDVYPGDIFFFYEVQAPDGYKKDNSVSDGKLITIVKGTTSYSVRYTDEPKSMDVNLLKTDDSNNPLAGAQFDLYFKESYNPPTNSINESEISPKLLASKSVNGTAPEPPAVSNSGTISSTRYSYTAAEAPDASESTWILPRTDNDYIYFRDYNISSSQYSGDNNGRWINTLFNINEFGQSKEIFYDHRYWLKAVFTASGKETREYSVWERFVDHYDGKETVVWKIQPPDGYEYVEFILCDGANNNNHVRNTEKFKYVLGNIYTKTNKGKYDNGQYGYPVKGEHWSTYWDSAKHSSDPSDHRITYITSTPNTEKYVFGQSSKDGGSPSTLGSMAQADRYIATPQKLVFHCNSKVVWHNIHIEFFDKNQQPIGQEFPGYMMEPYAYAGNDYRINGYLTYELTIPKDAKYFRVNDGAPTNTDYGYYSKITEIYSGDTNKYYKIDGSYTNSNQKNIKLVQSTSFATNSGKKYTNQNEIESDYDYIYFATPKTGGWNKVYAHFYGGGDLQADNWQRACYSIWPGLAPVGTEYKADENGTKNVEHHSDIYNYTTNPDSTFEWKDGSTTYTVYKFRIPLGDRTNYKKVIFNNGLSKSSGGKLTSPIEYSAGYIYKKSGSSTKHYEEKNTYTYTGRGDELCVKMNDSTLAKWDDLHITFYDSGKNQILQGKDGYVMKYSGTDTSGNTYFSMLIPSNAAYFSLNNGIGKSDSHNLSLSGKYEILPLNASGNENTSQNFTKGNMVYTLNDSTLSKTLPEFTEDTSSSEVTLDAYPSPRGDYIYIRNDGNVLTSKPTFAFYESETSSTAIDISGLNLGVNTHDGSPSWYSVGIPTDATEFTMNGGSTRYPIYQKTSQTTTSDLSMNFTPGGMYYQATSTNTLNSTPIWPTFSDSTDAQPHGEDVWSNTERFDALYLVCANKSAWDGMTVTFYDAGGTAIKNGSNENIRANYVGKLTSGNPAVSGVSTTVTDAVGHWFKVRIPDAAKTFVATANDKSTVRGDIYEYRTKTARYRTDYTLGDMQYRISNTGTGSSPTVHTLTRFYPIFTQDAVYTMPDNDDVSSTSGSTLVDESQVLDSYIEDSPNAPTTTSGTSDEPVLHATASNTITYTWQEGTAGDGLLRFNDTNTGWGTVYAAFYESDDTKISRTAMTADGTNQFKISVPSIDDYPTLSYVVFSKVDSSSTDIKTGHVSLTSENTYGKNKIFNATKTTDGTRSYLYLNRMDGFTNNPYIWFYSDSSGNNYVTPTDTDHHQSTGLVNWSTNINGPNPNSSHIMKVAIPSTATYVKFGVYNDYNQHVGYVTSIKAISGITKGKGIAVDPADITNGYVQGSSDGKIGTYEFDLQTYNLSDGSVSYGGSFGVYTGSGTTTTVYSSKFQPEDRYGYIQSAANQSDTNGTTSTTNNFVKVVNNVNGLTDLHIAFYTDSAGSTRADEATGVSGQTFPTNGIKLKPDTVSTTDPAIDGTQYTPATGPYYVRLPKNAKYAQLYNGSTTVGSIVDLADSSGKTGGITLTISGDSSSQTVSKSYVSRGDTGIQVNAKKTDMDYIYFTDEDGTMSGIRAYYFGDADGEYCAWPGVAPSYSYTDSNGKTVYAFQYPTREGSTGKAYPYVIFNSGGTYPSSTMTIALNYSGSGNYSISTDTTQYGTNNSTAINAKRTNVTPKTNNPTVNYSTSNKHLFFVNNGTYNFGISGLSDRYIFDDVHIEFFDMNKTPLQTTAPGYVMDKIGTYNKEGETATGDLYRIAIPSNAQYFRINNGTGKGSGTTKYNVRNSVIEEIAANGIYKFVDESNATADVWDGSAPSSAADLDDHNYKLKLINEKQPDPEDDDIIEPRNYEVRLARVETKNSANSDNGNISKIIWLKPAVGYEEENPQTTFDSEYLDYEGVNNIADFLENNAAATVKVKKLGTYYWKETKVPTGYKIPDGKSDEKIFIIEDRSNPIANIGTVTFINEKLPEPTNKVILTKTAKEKVGAHKVGSTLTGAKFLLYVNDGDSNDSNDTLAGTFNQAKDASNNNISGEYTYVSSGGAFNTNASDSTKYMETGNVISDTEHYGKLTLNGLPVGDYYLKEMAAPAGYSVNDSNTGTNRRVYFSIGGNTVEKEISCTDEMDAAYIRLFEHISEKKAAWGDPTFIFKITNTASGAKASYVALTVNDDGTITDTTNHRVLKWIDSGTEQPFTADPINDTLYENWLVEATSETEYKGMYHIDSQGRIKVEPGTYSITRVPVSRYEFVTSGNLVYTTDTEPTGTYTVNSSGTETAETVTLTAGQTGDIHYYDKVGYYDKFSQVDTEVNKFYKLESGANKTIKGIRIADYHSTATSGELALTGSDLTIYAIYADGTEGELNSTEKAKITFSYTDVDDEPAPFTPTLSSDSKTLTISDVTTYTGNVYTITATYPYDSNTNFTAKFDLVFSRT